MADENTAPTPPADPPESAPPPPPLLGYPEVEALLGVSKATIRRLVARGEFPAPIIVGQRYRRWLPAEVDRWLLDRGRARLMRKAAGFVKDIAEGLDAGADLDEAIQTARGNAAEDVHA